MKHLLVAAVLLLTTSAYAQEYAIIPDPTITPGAVRSTDVHEICSKGTRALRHWSRERDNKILQEYGLHAGPHPYLQIDHLIPLELGGADADENLWPNPYAIIEPTWSAEKKDELENRLRDLVCNGKLDIQVAQKAIADDWTAAYKLYVEDRK